MTTHSPYGPPGHSLHLVTLSGVLDIKSPSVGITRISGHSDTCVNPLWTVPMPMPLLSYDQEPNADSVVCLALQGWLQDILRDLPATEERARFVIDGGLDGWLQGPLF